MNIETRARILAENNGRPWAECGEYEREEYRDAARQDEPPAIEYEPHPALAALIRAHLANRRNRELRRRVAAARRLA